ncbi:energy transducer TonB [Pedobacter antarcticus]|uniref:energy transducer TonB n=1 Tax=Pedobacter antarcticus TaxID=34086 RepID=UPI00292E2EA8|nr:energy transducer TonB [Pedobacter antarcticus]
MENLFFLHHNVELNLNIMLNFNANLNKSTWTALVFKGRNKNYGAYVLRAESGSNTLKAFMLTVPVFVLLFAGPALYSRFNPVQEIKEEVQIPVELNTLVPQKPLERKAPEPVKAKVEAAAPRQEIKKFSSNIKVVDRPDLTEEPPRLDELKNADPGQLTQSGVPATGSATLKTGDGGGNAAVTTTGDNTIYDAAAIDKYPEFDGGAEGWTKFIRRNLRYPAAAQEQDIQGKVFISFVVETDGSVTDVKILKGIGGGCDEEAMRVIRKSPKWTPGRQYNQSVRVRYTMPLSFTLAQ